MQQIQPEPEVIALLLLHSDHLDCHHMACTGQSGDQAQSAWVYERRVLLDHPDLLL